MLCTTRLVTTTWRSMPASLSACDMEQTVTSNNFHTSQIQDVLSKRDYLKDLGVAVCRDGTFKKHIQTTVKTPQNQCSWILRTFMTREVIPMLTLWKSLVQCKLDYCSQLWSPTRNGDIQAIEMVQNSFLRKLPAIRHITYWQKLKLLKLYSQERCRERYTIIYMWRILEGQVPCINSLDSGAKVKSIWHIRRGRECQIPSINHHTPRNIQALKHATLPVRGQQLFNTPDTKGY